VNQLIEAAQSVVDRWDTPLWKDAPATAESINALRNALDSPRLVGEMVVAGDMEVNGEKFSGIALMIDHATIAAVKLPLYQQCAIVPVGKEGA